MKCLCSDCINVVNYKGQKKVIKKEKIEVVGEADEDLDIGIEFEPVCFIGFGNDELREKVGVGGLVVDRLGIAE